VFVGRAQVPSVVRALHQTERREGVDEVRHAHGAGTAPVLGYVGDDTDSETGLPGAHEVRRVRGPVPRAGAETETAAKRHAEQVTRVKIYASPVKIGGSGKSTRPVLFFREICQAILEKHSDEYQLGTNRVFLRENLERHLERERAAILNTAAITLQRNVRGFLARTRYTVKRQSAIRLQASVRCWMQRKRYATLKRGVVRAQAAFRGRRQRKRYNQLKVNETFI